MRVLMTADAVGGIWAYADELARALEDGGCEVVLATLGPNPAPDRTTPHLSCRLEWQEDPWEDVAAAGDWLMELAQELRPDVVHLNSYALASRRWPAPVVVVAHSCVRSWHEAVRGEPAPPPFKRYGLEVERGLRAADAVVAPSMAMLNDLRRLYPADGLGVTIHNGVSPHPFEPVEKEPVVLAAGRLWDEAKGLAAIDDAAARAVWPMQVAGDRGGVEASHARLLGPLGRDELRERMGRAAVFAHPARYEPFGLAVLEAALAGCALVLGNIATLRELWDGAALFVPRADGHALASAVEILARDERLRRRLGEAARERAARHDARAMARAYSELYSSLVTRAGVAA
jgi:glycogen synthase